MPGPSFLSGQLFDPSIFNPDFLQGELSSSSSSSSSTVVVPIETLQTTSPLWARRTIQSTDPWTKQGRCSLSNTDLSSSTRSYPFRRTTVSTTSPWTKQGRCRTTPKYTKGE